MKNENNEDNSILAYPDDYDGPVAAPEHHKVVFENDRIRIMEFRVPPGDIVPAHTHRWQSINYVVSLSDFLSYDTGGNVTFDSRTAHFQAKEGETFCLSAYPMLHSVENIGQGEIHGISVELKE